MLFRTLISQWISSQAQGAVREAMHEALRGAATETAAPPREDEPQRCDIACLFALEYESGGLEDLLSAKLALHGQGFTAVLGLLDRRRVLVVRTGVGASAAENAATAVIAGHQPQWVISAGFAGGLQPNVRRGDVVLANEIVSTSGGRCTIDMRMSPAALEADRSLHLGRVLTATRILRTPDEKRAAGEQSGALAVDLETYAVAEVCRQSRVKMLAVRVISDAVDDELPRDVEKLSAPRTAVRQWGVAAGVVFRRPGSVKDLLRLRTDAIAASDKLAQQIAELAASLPLQAVAPPPPLNPDASPESPP